MVRPNFLPRTLKGLGGKRFYNLPGVTYPEEVLKAPKGCCPITGLPYAEPPKGTVSTREAARLLGSSLSAARNLLSNHKIPYRLVALAGQPPSTYWSRHRVQKLADAKFPMLTEKQLKTHCSIAEAALLLQLGRTSIQRHVSSGRLRSITGRCMTKLGPRKVCYVYRPDIKKMAAHRRAAALREAQEQQATAASGEDPS